ncbi:serine hydrolase [Luteitalea sp. TBR-22]|uniref:serine hydrolase domain-containing protein n=1 Tax=Luteitalea sp. TBR-22 TaxID=2802971 RepID=UPI001AF1EDCA|nr:serine hydrolase domain-containing protein [Luteitalea sp. TBR-22]BCS34811.1 serine hydrolase [Luteitalea sp. TBR-22]
MLYRAFALILLLAAPALGQPAATPATSLADNPDVQASVRLFSAWLEGQMAYRGLPGVAVGVVHDQQLVWSKGYGFANVEKQVPMTIDTRFRIASNSKLFAAIAILQLREAGKLRLDDPVVKHLPWFAVAPAGPDDGPITIEQLLSHSSGLQREARDHWSSLSFPTESELRALMSGRKATFPPQTRWKYSNLAFAIAGMVVEQITGQRWADYVQARILAPLGMTSSSIDTPDPGLATPYASRTASGTRRILPFVDAHAMAAAAGMTSTVSDLSRFISAQFRRGPAGGANVLSAGSWREALRVRSVEEDWESGSGLGFDHVRVKGRTYVGHGGGYPGNTTMTRAQIDDKIGVVVLTNTNDSNPGAIADQLLATVGAAVVKAAQPKATAQWDDAYARFAGLYRSPLSDDIIQVVLLNKQLVLLQAQAPAAESRVRLEPLGDGRFRLMAPGGGQSVGEIVRFEEVAGRPTRMILGDTWSERVDRY